MTPLEREILEILKEESISGLNFEDLANAIEKPIRKTYHAVQSLLERCILVEKDERPFFPSPMTKTYRRIIDHVIDHLSEIDQHLVFAIQTGDEEWADEIEEWFEEKTYPQLRYDRDNLATVKTHWEAVLEYYRDHRMTQPDAPFKRLFNDIDRPLEVRGDIKMLQAKIGGQI